MSNDESNVDGELLSPVSATSQQSQWPRPQTPIDPRKLAKLANALGISTPVPMSTSTDSTKQLSSRSTSSFGRSPTPSAASTSNLSAHSTSSAFQSKFLLHVIPPPNLPHDTNTADVMLTPPPTSASGYHTQFRRGTLVPFLPSFHAQLGAIAKEYALPSTTGMILYLVTSSSTPNSSPSPSPVPSLHGRRSSLDISEEPGPRLSEDIWRHLWSRVVKTELGGYPSRAGTPVGLGLNADASPGTTPTLRPLVSSNGKAPLAPSGSSSISSSVNGASETSQSEATTPDTSLPPDSNPDALDLPGLHSPSLIPILAKVEFDIDRRKATWYGPWVRSRKHNHQKRIAQRGPDDDSRLHLKVIDRQKKPRFLSSKDVADDLSDEPEYAPRAGSPEEDEDEDATAQLEDNISVKLSVPSPPPLAETEHASSPLHTLQSTKRVPPRLVLPPTDSNIIPADDEANPIGRRPKLAYRESDTEDEGGDTRRPPESKRSPLEEKRGGAFFDDLLLGLRFTDSADYDEDDPYDRRRSQYIMQQRLDEIERNLHQFSPRKLKYEDDAYSLTSTPPRSSKSAQFLSPSDRSLPLPGGSSNSQSESNPEQPKWPAVPYSQLTGGNDEDTSPDISLDAGDFPSPPKFALNGVSNAIPLSPYKKSVSEDSGESEESKARRREHVEGHEPSYPSVMPPSLRSGKRPDSAGEVIPLSPDPFGRFPVETVPPVPAMPSRMSESSHRSSSSQSRTAFSFDGAPEGGATLDRDDSMSSVSDKHTSTKLSSRFSLDSDDHNALQASSRSGAQPGGASLNPVKSIRTLWRKSRKSSVSGERPAPMGPVPRVPSINGGQVHAQAQTQTQSQPARPPSQQQSLGVPMPRVSEEVVTNAMLPPGYPRRGPAHPDVAVAITTGPSLTTAEMIRRARGEQSINAIHFDQESPYPIRRAPTPNSPSTSPVPARPQPSPTPSSGEPEDSKGSTRKSILKSWRGNGSAEDDSVSAAPRKRRPSVMDLVRNSRLSAAGEAVPPSPMLPEQYANGQSQAGQRTTRSSKGSSYSSRSSGQLLHTPMGPPAVQDETFEIVVESSHAKSPSLSYPYHELDHQA